MFVFCITCKRQEPQRVCDSCFQHINVGDKRCVSRLVPYIIGGESEANRSHALNELLDIVQEVMSLFFYFFPPPIRQPLLPTAFPLHSSSLSSSKLHIVCLYVVRQC